MLPELENPFFPRLAHHLEITLARLGLSPVLCSQTLGGVHEDDYVAILLEHSVAGIVFVSGVHALVDSDPARYQRLLDLGLPIVLVNGALAGLDAPTRVHRRRGRRRARRPAPRAHGPPPHRRRARPAALPARPAQAPTPSVDAVPGAGSCPTTSTSTHLVESTAYTVEGGRQAAERLLDRGVTGIVCGSDVMALGVIRAARAGAACGCPRTCRSSAATTAR